MKAWLLARALGHGAGLALCPDDSLALERLGRRHAAPDALRDGVEEILPKLDHAKIIVREYSCERFLLREELDFVVIKIIKIIIDP